MKKFRTAGLWLLLVIAVMFLVWQQQSQQPKLTMSFAEFLSDVEAENVAGVEVNGNEIVVTQLQGLRYKTSGVLDAALLAKLSEQDVHVRYATGWIQAQ